MNDLQHRVERIRLLASQGYCTADIARDIGTSTAYVRSTASRKGIKITKPENYNVKNGLSDEDIERHKARLKNDPFNMAMRERA